MHTFLCRIMALVFALNCLVPAPSAWAQTPARSNTAAKVKSKIQAQVNAQTKDSVSAAVEALENAKTVPQMRDALVKLHQVMDKKYAAEQQEEKARQAQQIASVAVASSTYVAPRASAFPLKKTQNEVLARLSKDDLLLSDLINYIDPFDPAKYNIQNVIYAGEVLGNSLDSVAAVPLDPDTQADLNKQLPLIQLRVLYRLNQLTPKQLSDIYTVMAIGTLRITMWKIHSYYLQTGQQDPLMKPLSSSSSSQKFVMKRVPGDSNTAVITGNSTQPKNAFFLPDDIYAQLMNRFLGELQVLKAKNPQEGSEKYQLAITLSDYAVTYALLTSPQRVKDIVKIFDQGPARSVTGKLTPGKFQQQYSALLNSIFTSLFESTKYLAAPNTWNQVLEMLQEFSNPAKYSLPTRIFALEAASLMFSSKSCQAAQGAIPNYSVSVRCNTGSPQAEKYRALLAKRTVDLYEPLNNGSTFGMEDYGLDSAQMKMLSDKLAYIYNGFANDDLKLRPNASKSNDLALDAEGKSIVLNDGVKSIPFLKPLNNGYQFQRPDGKLVTISGFGRASDGQWVTMNLSNGLNSKKVDNERGVQFVSFVGNAIFWIYGGEIFSWIGTAYRSAKGAVISLPKALKAAAAAPKGRAGTAFSIEVAKEVRLANFPKRFKQDLGSLVAESEVAKTVKGNKLPVKPGYVPEMESQFRPLSTKHALQGKYSIWNPKRWIGDTPAKAKNIWFTQPTPSGGMQVGVANVEKTSLSTGIRNYDDLRKLRASFRSVEDPTQHVFPRFYDYFTRKTIQQEVRLKNAMQTAARNGAFNVWMPIKTPTYAAGAAPNGETTTWWNLTRLGRPGNQLAFDGAQNVVLTPTVSKAAATSKVVDPTQMRNAITMPLSDITSGNWEQTLINHFFTKAERTGAAKYLMPTYTPNANFWKEAASNWRFGMTAGRAVANNTRFWQGFKANMIFFGVWDGFDALLYPAMNSWITRNAIEDQNKEMAKYGDTFDPKKLEEDNRAFEEDKKKLEEAGVAMDERSLSSYMDVAGAKEESSTGSSVSWLLLAGRRSLPEGMGKLSFVTDQDMASFKQMAKQIQLNRANRAQAKALAEKNAQMEAQIKQELIAKKLEQLTNERAFWDEYLTGLGALHERAMEVCDSAMNQIRALSDSKVSLETALDEIQKLMDQFNTELGKVYEELLRMEELLYEKQKSTFANDGTNISEEEYDPYEGYDPYSESWDESYEEDNPWTRDYYKTTPAQQEPDVTETEETPVEYGIPSETTDAQ